MGKHMSISSTAVFNASHVLQFSYIFNNEVQWMNAEFFNSEDKAFAFVRSMIAFWPSEQRIENEGWRVIENK